MQQQQQQQQQKKKEHHPKLTCHLTGSGRREEAEHSQSVARWFGKQIII
jgi:hypothetical protein